MHGCPARSLIVILTEIYQILWHSELVGFCLFLFCFFRFCDFFLHKFSHFEILTPIIQAELSDLTLWTIDSFSVESSGYLMNTEYRNRPEALPYPFFDGEK